MEHIVPRVRGGASTADNLALACQGCNNHKYDKIEAGDPTSGEVVPLYHPRRERWRDHFTWGDDFALIVGVSPIGRATIVALHLNRPQVVNLRRLLGGAGQHPPLEPDG